MDIPFLYSILKQSLYTDSIISGSKIRFFFSLNGAGMPCVKPTHIASFFNCI